MRKVPLAERLWARVEKRGPDECWEWTGYRVSNGYGRISRDGGRSGSLATHRLAYELAYGSIPDGLHVLHSCDNPPCCNPLHLSLGTQADNMRDMVSKARSAGQSKTRCKRGHPLSPENVRMEGHRRRCIVCKAAYDKQRQSQSAYVRASPRGSQASSARQHQWGVSMIHQRRANPSAQGQEEQG